MINIHPIKLQGKWVEGFALDKHTVDSVFLGDNEYGHPVFKTTRSEIGELLYKLKYGADRSVINEIAETATSFIINNWEINRKIDLIVPVPPSNIRRKVQPVVEIAKQVGSKLNIAICMEALIKIKETKELKDVFDYSQRYNLLKSTFTVNESLTKGKDILIFDDLYRSGATLNTISEALYEKGNAHSVYVLTISKTRSIQ